MDELEDFNLDDLEYIKKMNFRTIKINEKKAEKRFLEKKGLHKYINPL
jgi:hypothetical protein